MLSGSRTINHCRYPHHFQIGFPSKNAVTSSMFCNLKQALQLSSLVTARPFIFHPSFPAKRLNFYSNNSSSSSSSSNSDVDASIVSCVQPSQRSQLSDSLSEHEEAQEARSKRLSPLTGGIVALGKFDALHIGHRELAVQASKVGVAFLLSFAGMAELLGWEPRAPIVATCDRKRVLFSWAPYCGNFTPKELQIEFSKVRSLSPRQFVEKLSLELGVHGVVAGENYRFGFKASGDTSDLVRLCKEYGMQAHIISSVMDKNRDTKNTNPDDPKEQGQVSSTRVRHALALGDMKYVAQLLGRHHRLMLLITETEQERFINDSRLSAPKSCVLNLAPAEGLYEKCSLIVGDNIIVPCTTVIDKTQIHLEVEDKLATSNDFRFQDLRLLGIEFSDELRQVV